MAVEAAHLIFIGSIVSLAFVFSAADAAGMAGWGNTKILESETTSNYIRCFDAKSNWRWLRLWSSLNVKVENDGPVKHKIPVVRGVNMSEVEKLLAQSSGFLPSLLPTWEWLEHNRRMSPLLDNCIGVKATDAFYVTVTETFINGMYILPTLIGMFVFLAAPRLSKSVVFHYSTGITVGVLASLLVLVYVLSRFVPKRAGAVSLLIGGWSLCLYFFRWIFDNFLTMQYKNYIVGYLVVAAAISFAVCYWYGPVTNDRTVFLIQLFLQFLGLVSIYKGSQHEGATIAIIVSLVSMRWLPRTSGRLRTVLRWRRGPEKIKLLTEDEYYEQGRVETKRALDQLREYCRSPDCNQWKMIANLESPKRFAQFVVGEADHVTGNELSAYEEDLSLLTLDSSTSDSDRMSIDSDMETD